MKFYFAPLEGITGYIYRNAYHRYFDQIDTYYAPFISANQSGSFKTKELNDVRPENNEGITLIPQILTNNAKDFITTAAKLKAMGYDQVNLNLGCPSGTVVSKHKGAGFLAKKEELNAFLEEIFASNVADISIKTRIGKESPEEFDRLLAIYNQYPVKELIIHPRIQTDFYKNKPNLTVFSEALTKSTIPICYNGDIFSPKDYEVFTAEYPQVEAIMLGRGLLASPGLIAFITRSNMPNKDTYRQFHEQVLEGYRKALSGDTPVLYKMKEFWFYLSNSFTEHEAYSKKIRKASRMTEYESIVDDLFREQELLTQIDSFSFVK